MRVCAKPSRPPGRDIVRSYIFPYGGLRKPGTVAQKIGLASDPEAAKFLLEKAQESVDHRWRQYKQMAEMKG